jgi:hypothetical protein
MDNDRDRNLIEIPQASETQRLIVGRIALRFTLSLHIRDVFEGLTLSCRR